MRGGVGHAVVGWGGSYRGMVGDGWVGLVMQGWVGDAGMGGHVGVGWVMQGWEGHAEVVGTGVGGSCRGKWVMYEI